jgi:hypothetical protein
MHDVPNEQPGLTLRRRNRDAQTNRQPATDARPKRLNSTRSGRACPSATVYALESQAVSRGQDDSRRAEMPVGGPRLTPDRVHMLGPGSAMRSAALSREDCTAGQTGRPLQSPRLQIPYPYEAGRVPRSRRSLDAELTSGRTSDSLLPGPRAPCSARGSVDHGRERPRREPCASFLGTGGTGSGEITAEAVRPAASGAGDRRRAGRRERFVRLFIVHKRQGERDGFSEKGRLDRELIPARRNLPSTRLRSLIRIWTRPTRRTWSYQ